MKTLIPLFVLLTLCSCGGGSGGGSSSSTTETSSETNSATAEMPESQVLLKSSLYRTVWDELHQGTYTSWKVFGTSEVMKLRMGLEFGNLMEERHSKLSWKELSLLGEDFYLAKKTNKKPDFKLIAKKIFKEMK